MTGIMCTIAGLGSAVSPIFPFPSLMSAYDFGSSSSDAYFWMSNLGWWQAVGNDWDEGGTWLNAGVASSYEVRLTQDDLSGGVGVSMTGSALGTWLNMGTTRSWTLLVSGSGKVGEFFGTASIRLAASPFTVYTSGTVYLNCDTS